MAEKASRWLNGLDSFGIKRSISAKSESNYLRNSSTFLITRTGTLFEIIESVTIPQLLGSLIK
jgi:hypothetical protein